jgi:hypothetical protein
VSIKALIKKFKKYWLPEPVEVIPGTIFVFGQDYRPVADEIANLVEQLKEFGEREYILKIDNVFRTVYFIGDDFYCPYKTTTSEYLGISDGIFYQCKKDLKLNIVFETISYDFLVELQSALSNLVFSMQ